MSSPDDPYAAPGGEHPQEPPAQASPGDAAAAPPPTPPPGYGPPTYGSAEPPPQQPYAQPPYVQPTQPGQPGYGQPTYGAPAYGTVPPAGYGYAPAPRTNGLAIAALVCSLAGLVTCISAPVGAVLGFVALSQIKKSGEGGRGLALAGAWIGVIITALVVIGTALLIAFGVWFANDLSDSCKRSDYSTDQAYEDCINRQFDETFNSGSTSD